MENVGRLSPEMYDAQEELFIPNFLELHHEVADLVAASEINPKRWLDTGCGTGTTVEIAKKLFPHTNFIMADPDAGMLDKCRIKLGPGLEYIEAETHALDLPDGGVDVVSAIMCHHYYSRSGREAATANCYRMLSDMGLYITFEHCLPPDDEGVNIALKRWKHYLVTNGIDEDSAETMVGRYRTAVFPITIESQLALLRKCGFDTVGVFWRSYTVTGFYAYKSDHPL